MRIAVCGCSFSAISRKEEFRNTHFSEVLSETLNADLFNFAMPGASNGNIRLQVEEAMDINPDIVILTPSFVDRIEIPIYPLFDDTQSMGYDVPRAKNYNPKLKLRNIETVWQDAKVGKMSTMFSDPVAVFRDGFYIENNLIYHKTLETIENYMLFMFDYAWKKQQHEWMFRDAVNQLKIRNIQCIFQPSFLYGDPLKSYQYDKTEVDYFFKGILDPSDILEYTDNLIHLAVKEKIEVDPGYHTNPDIQRNFADILISKYIKR